MSESNVPKLCQKCVSSLETQDGRPRCARVEDDIHGRSAIVDWLLSFRAEGCPGFVSREDENES